MTREEVDDSNPVALAIWEFENAINGSEADNNEYPNYGIHINEYKTALAALKTCAVKLPKDAPCDYCNCAYEQKHLFHENNYKPHTCMESYIVVSKSTDGKQFLIEVDLWDGANAWAAFEINYCPMCGRKLEVEG